jgi:hypothetical protein
MAGSQGHVLVDVRRAARWRLVTGAGLGCGTGSRIGWICAGIVLKAG